MTEKVKVTREQAEAIEKWENGTQLLKAAVVGLLKQGVDEPIAEMPTETLAKAIYIGYEVEPEFKVGDWVVHEYDKKPREIIRESNYKNGDCGEYVVDNGNGVLPKFLRHATPEEIAEEKERRWWSKLGRNVNEYRVDDIVKGLGCITGKWRLGPVKKILKYENAVQIEDISDGSTMDLDKESCKLICPAENRLDREGGE